MHLRNVPDLDSIFLMGKRGLGSSTMSVFLESHCARTKWYSHCPLEHLVLVTEKNDALGNGQLCTTAATVGLMWHL